MKPPGTGILDPDALQARAAPSATIKDIKTLGKYTAKGETRFSAPAKFRKLARTRRATLPPFLVDEGPERDCSGLPHKAVSTALLRGILPAPLQYRGLVVAPTQDYYDLPQKPARGAQVP